MELTENNLENTTDAHDDEPVKKKKRKNPFNNSINRKEEKLKRQQRRARIIIRNISYKATEESLKKHFEQFGKIKEINLLKRPDGKLVGCAFIQYEAVNQAAKAILKGTNKEFLGRPVIIDWAVGKDEYKKRVNQPIKKEDPENLQEEKEDEDIKQEDEEEQAEGNNIEEQDKEESAEIKEESDSEEQQESENDSDDDDDDEYSDDEDIKEDADDDDDHDDKKSNIKNKVKQQKFHSNDITEGCTVFIKNVPFDATNDDLRKLCRKFGPIYYALINIDPISGHSKGTAFVKFKTKESADLCLKAGEEFRLMDSHLEPFPALSRDDIRNKTDKTQRNEPKDSRNLYLAKEGLIMAGSKAAEGVSASDMAKRHKLEQIKTQILKNLNRFISKNRLSIHNLPLNYDNEKLRKIVLKLTGLKAHECRIMRENKPTADNPQGKSKGFGFLSFKTHQDALTALRKLNNNPNVFGPINRPIVAFSIEDRSVHNIKENRLKKSRENNPTFKKKLEKITNNKKKKKAATAEKQVDNKRQIRKEIRKAANPKNKDNSNETTTNELEDFVGVPAKPGTFVRMRSNKKLRSQALEHLKKVSSLKKIEKRKREKKILKQEKMEIDRPKQGKRKAERDKFSFLVDKYKQLIDSAAARTEGPTKSKRTKWYVE